MHPPWSILTSTMTESGCICITIGLAHDRAKLDAFALIEVGEIKTGYGEGHIARNRTHWHQ